MPLIDKQQNISNDNNTKKNLLAFNNRNDSGYMSPKKWNNFNNKINVQNTKTNIDNKRQNFWVSSQCSSSQSSINSQNQINIDEERIKLQQKVSIYFNY